MPSAPQQGRGGTLVTGTAGAYYLDVSARASATTREKACWARLLTS
ncbi:hypothetical protein HF283_05670 [Acidithiobacillus ferrooxidans]|nr:hypothetical protein [Acidithiobacillus ferridurans]MBU2805647.1 hypothetical protein [Acidithiobacillus ferridurans]MBU2823600.1 hypothetical protein [Acidithiobacillus ferrooxidans]